MLIKDVSVQQRSEVKTLQLDEQDGAGSYYSTVSTERKGDLPTEKVVRKKFRYKSPGGIEAFLARRTDTKP